MWVPSRIWDRKTIPIHIEVSFTNGRYGIEEELNNVELTCKITHIVQERYMLQYVSK